jgi:protein arginine N-methyltransferase 1
VQAGDVVQVSFAYRCGGSIPSLEASLRVEILHEAALQPRHYAPAYA